jgi:HD-like signal output (HDOD) protein
MGAHALNYLSLLLAVFAAVAVFFLLKKKRDPVAPIQSDRRIASEPKSLRSVIPDDSEPKSSLRPIVRLASPQINAMLRSFALTRSADLPSEDATAIMAMLRRIPRPPHALHKLVSPEFLADANTAQLSEMVIAEPQVAAKVLVMVNSPFYGLKAPLGSIGQAITFLGMNTVRGICLQYLLDESFQSTDPEIKRIFDRIWNASAFASELCFKLAQLLQLPEPGTLVTQVVLSFLGPVASHSLLRKDLVLSMAKRGLLERSRVEQEHLGLCAAEIGSLLMQSWELPQSIIDQVRDIDLVLVTPYDQTQAQRASRMAFCYFCARLGEKLAQGEVKDLAAYHLEQDQGPEFFHLLSYLQVPALAGLTEFLHLPELVSSINAMVLSMQIRR